MKKKKKLIFKFIFNIVYPLIKVFQNEGLDYFVDMMPCLHNYVTVGMETLVTQEKYMLIVFNMCKIVSNTNKQLLHLFYKIWVHIQLYMAIRCVYKLLVLREKLILVLICTV